MRHWWYLKLLPIIFHSWIPYELLAKGIYTSAEKHTKYKSSETIEWDQPVASFPLKDTTVSYPAIPSFCFYPNYSKCWLPKVQYSQHVARTAASMRRWLGNCIICSRWWMNNRNAYILALALSGRVDTHCPHQIHSVCWVRPYTKKNTCAHSLSF